MHEREKNSPDKRDEGHCEVSIKVEGSDKEHDECVRCACGNSPNRSKSFTNVSYCKSDDEEDMTATSVRLNLPESPIRKSVETYSIVDLHNDS